jgi:DNA repair exonuclease SbcCD ATPase subunit
MEKINEVIKTKKIINIPPNGNIRVDWQDYPENRTLETINRVKTYFSEKYGLSKTSIKINFIPIIKNSAGKVVDITDGLIDNIMDTAYQRNLFNEWVKLNDIDINFDRLCRLDDKVNDVLVNLGEEDIRYRRWSISKLWIDNFLSFGDDNVIEYNSLKGLTVVNSLPANQGGKTIFSIDSLLFLFFGKTTKTDTAIEIFNTFTNKDEVIVGGQINIDGEEYIIERKLVRKQSKTGSYKTSSELNFYKLLSDGTQENLVGEQRRETDSLITDTIGSFDDFMLTIVSTAKNLEDLLETKPTQRGRLLTKFIGLEVIEKKEEINKGLMTDFKSRMKSNVYNTKQLEFDIEENIENIKENKNLIKESNIKLKDLEDKIGVAKNKKEILLSEKYIIDEEVKNVNPKTLQKEIDDLTEKGVKIKEELDAVNDGIKKLVKVDYDEDIHDEIRGEERYILLRKGKEEDSIERTEGVIKNLEEGEICLSCKRPLEDVDHSKEIKQEKEHLKYSQKELKKINKELEKINKSLEQQSDLKSQSEWRDKLELTRDRTEVEIDSLRVDVKEKLNLLKNYQRNIEYIEKNRDVESKILGYNQLIDKLNLKRDNLRNEIQDYKNDNKNKKQQNIENEKIIQQILKEEEVLKIFEVYNRMIGKNGISKLVLSSVIPVINYELCRLLDEVCDFEIELEMNNKNEVDFNIIKNNVTKKLKSGSGLETTLASLALRCVLGRISTLPKPNIIVFDEVLGKVANINLDYVKIFFDKIKKMYEIILLITHNPITQDWADKIITIEKNNDISSLQIQ